MNKKYPVCLTPAERTTLTTLLAAGTAPARKLTHARILLKADQAPAGPGWVDERIAEAVEVSQPTVARIRQQYVEQGLAAALNRRAPARTYRRTLDGEQEARLVQLACGQPPAGHAGWSLRLLADHLVELEIVETISYQTVGRVLKKNELKPWLKQQWCIAPQANDDFVWRMEDVLAVYTRPYDPASVWMRRASNCCAMCAPRSQLLPRTRPASMPNTNEPAWSTSFWSVNRLPAAAGWR